MIFLFRQHLEHLKSALLSLPPTGDRGFEGLIAAALREVAGVPFRLANSGSQFGVDGKAVYELDGICFEAKRYDESVPRSGVLSKLAELSISDTETDIWVLCATTKIASQLADQARAFGAKSGILVVILDWSETDIPPLAAALALGGARVRKFLDDNLDNEETRKKAVAALDAIRTSPDFVIHAERIRELCNWPAAGLTLARRANVDWLTDAFSSRKRAKAKLGQPLSPGEAQKGLVQQRQNLVRQVTPYLTGASDESVLCILGGEGNGKSWLVAQAWLNLADKPLMIFMRPDDFVETSAGNELLELLVSTLIRQTRDTGTATTRERWRRRLTQWRSQRASTKPRILCVVDGINQRPKIDWGRIIDALSDELHQLGGRLVITARTPYFRDRVKRRLSVGCTEVDVPEWTEPERDGILRDHRISASDLSQPVAASLRNPRLLSIALELLDRDDVASLDELSLSRLLFEHIRASERDTPLPQTAQEFARHLQEHAQEMISRVRAKQRDDVKVFESDIGAVADGRFYRTLDSDPTRYSLNDEGLTLALGFAVNDRLRVAKRNARDTDGELEAILEPVSALDDTANVIIAALTVAGVGSNEEDIAASLVRGFAGLQNPSQSNFPAFVGLAKSQPRAFMRATRSLSLSGAHESNCDWVEEALIEASRSEPVWQEMAAEVHSWLSAYTLSPECGLHLGSESQAKIEEEREKNRKKLDEKLRSLAPCEQSLLEGMVKEEGDLSALSRFALRLLAGKPLALFAHSLVNWSFSAALNSDHGAPHKEFAHLVTFNRVDWGPTRAALLDASTPLREAKVSVTGKWALVNVLGATGHWEEGMEADSLVRELTKDWPLLPRWRLVEQYCATDPCDPASKEPDNLDGTAEQYAALDVTKLRQTMGQTREDHFFSMARLGLARFKPDSAIVKLRQFAQHVLTREGFPLRQGLFALRLHNALLTNDLARGFVNKWQETRAPGIAGPLSEGDPWIVSQYCLLLAFPFLSGEEQAELLCAGEPDEAILLQLLESTQPLDEHTFESQLQAACVEKSERKQLVLLALAKFRPVQLSSSARSQIGVLYRIGSQRIRTEALGVIARSDEEQLLREVVNSGWTAADPYAEGDFAVWYGSMVLLRAATKGLVGHDEILDRISTRLYGRAATMLNKAATRAIAQRVDASISEVIGLNADVAPEIEVEVPEAGAYEPSRFGVGTRPLKAGDVNEAMRRFAESEEAFKQRQQRNREAFLDFRSNLTKAKAQIILDHLTVREFATITSAAEDLADRWYELFMNIEESRLPLVHNLAVLLAHALAGRDAKRAGQLFSRLHGSRPFVRFTFGEASLQLDAMAVWAGSSSPTLDGIRFARLDRIGNDHDLALEVLAALLNGQQELLAKYIESKLGQQEPAEVARGVMVAGFSDDRPFNDGVVGRYEGRAGLVGKAQRAAKYAYDRNRWARYWFAQMCQTNENSDFWRYAVLFTKIVDGRFVAWRSSYEQTGTCIRRFGGSLDDEIRDRIRRWENHRNRKLFGMDAPDRVFLVPDPDNLALRNAA